MIYIFDESYLMNRSKMGSKRILTVVLAILGVGLCEGIRCFSCLNAPSDAECKKSGFVEQCEVNQFYCQTEVRAIGRQYPRYEITKRCKQDLACTNNERQNITGQCLEEALKTMPSVCRCCCGFSRCNIRGIDCLQERPGCTTPDAPDDGFVSCPNYPPVVEDTCRFGCRIGYKINGSESTTCELDFDGTYWTNPTPECEEKRCMPPMEVLEHGSVSCTDENRRFSECKFTCDPEYVLVGYNETLCQETAMWSHSMPECKLIFCNKPRPADRNRLESCSNDYAVGSKCSFTCKAGYDYVGPGEILCGVVTGTSRAEWDQDAGVCEESSCSDLRPTNAIKVCTNGNEFGSICTFTCVRGQYMEDEDGTLIPSRKKDLKCVLGPRWNPSGVPDCKPITCPFLSAPANGGLECNPAIPGNAYQTLCEYTCNDDYAVVPEGADPTTRCIDDMDGNEIGSWNRPARTCRRKSCKELGIDETTTEKVCTGGDLSGSQCTITCKTGHYMVGEDGNVILTNEVVIDCTTNETWSGEAPTCRPITCVPPKTDPANGDVRCSKGNLYESVCTFTCNSDYELIGVTTSECIPDGDNDEFGQWDPPGPTRCDDVACSQFPAPNEAPSSRVGSITCTPDSNFLPGIGWKRGTECRLQCNDNYAVKNSRDLVTCESDKEWSAGSMCCVDCARNPNLVVMILNDHNALPADIELGTKFIVNLVNKLVQDSLTVNVTVMNYANSVASPLLLGDNLNLDNFVPRTFETALRSAPKPTTGASNLGTALRNVNNDLFAPENLPPYEAPMVFIITRNAPSDEALAVSQSSALRNRDVHIRLYPIEDETYANPGANKAVFERITGPEGFVMDGESLTIDGFMSQAVNGVSAATEAVCNAQSQDLSECLYG